MIVAPHLTLPLTLVGGRFVAVEQGSLRHQQDQAEFALRTRPSTLDADPELGLRDLIARLGPAAPQVEAALLEYLPDARAQLEEDESRLRERIRNVHVKIREATEE